MLLNKVMAQFVTKGESNAAGIVIGRWLRIVNYKNSVVGKKFDPALERRRIVAGREQNALLGADMLQVYRNFQPIDR
jgi:hypothetical protein